MSLAYFKNIRSVISNCINDSQESIFISVAWFTSKELLELLIDKLESNCKIVILISDHLENRRLNFKKFIDKGGEIYIMPTDTNKFLHDKFAIFDNKELIAGSYNWTNSAEFYNHEFVIFSDESQLIKQFNFRFNILRKQVVELNNDSFSSNQILNADSNEAEFLLLEAELEQEFIESIRIANEFGAKIKSEGVISYIHKYGAIGGAIRLIKEGTDKLQSGLMKLWEVKRLDLSFENIILKDKYHKLFNEDVLKKARARLNELKYTV